MKTSGKLLAIAAGTVMVSALGAGIANASVPQMGPVSGVHATAPASTAADSDNVQQGDQTSPDKAAGSNNAKSTEGSTENAGEGEGSGQSDGPGGHQDPAGNVQHQGGNNEQ